MIVRDDFAGPGGWDVAAAQLGISTIGIESDADACATARAAGHRRERIGVHAQRVITRYRGGLTGYIASPPCQTFSAAGNGTGRAALGRLLIAARHVAAGHTPEIALALVADDSLDARSMLVLEPLHVIARHRPQWVTLEQVPPVLPVWEAYQEHLAQWGYSVVTGNLQAEQYGVPQTRKRAVLIAHQDRPVHLPVPTHSRFHIRDKAKLDHGVKPWVSMVEALGEDYRELKVRSNYGTGGDPAARGERTADEPAACVTTKVGRNQWLFVGGSQANATCRTLDEPAPTVFTSRTANMAWRESTATSSAYKVTVQEAGVLQTFPVDYPWRGTGTAQYQQVGNAIPPLLAGAILDVVLG